MHVISHSVTIFVLFLRKKKCKHRANNWIWWANISVTMKKDWYMLLNLTSHHHCSRENFAAYNKNISLFKLINFSNHLEQGVQIGHKWQCFLRMTPLSRRTLCAECSQLGCWYSLWVPLSPSQTKQVGVYYEDVCMRLNLHQHIAKQCWNCA